MQGSGEKVIDGGRRATGDGRRATGDGRREMIEWGSKSEQPLTVKQRMKIWVDADATPKPVKEILFRAAQRAQVLTTFVANQGLSTPKSPYLKTVQVPSGFDVADNYIVQQCEENDIVITADIPLAAEVVEKGALAINPRGEKYSRENIKQRLAMRDFMEEIRSTGQVTDGPKAYNQQDRQAFANSLDRLLIKKM